MTARARLPSSPLDALPLFASDRQLAEAIVGRAQAGEWLRTMLPVLEAKAGFPKVDPAHGGRPVPLVKLFYGNYLRLPADMSGPPDGDEDASVWRTPRRSRLRA